MKSGLIIFILLQIYRFIISQVMFESSKKEKKDRLNRQELKMFVDLINQKQQKPPSPLHSFLTKIKPQIELLNTLRVATCIEINYFIQTFFEIIKKIEEFDNDETTKHQSQKKVPTVILPQAARQQFKSIKDLKLGIIGGGVMGRLILNSLLVFSKDGLDPKNITVSTRQYQHLKSYNMNFGINIILDNQLVAEQSDILIICVPSTLDNWIICDLKDALNQRISEQNKIAPLVYVTTSNMNEEKLRRLFDFPIMCPCIRGEDIIFLQQLGKRNSVEEIQKELIPKILSENRLQELQSLFYFIFSRIFYSTASRTQSISSSVIQYDSSKTVSLNNTATLKQQNSSIGSNKLKQQNTFQREGIQFLKQLITDAIYQHDKNEKQSYLIRTRKWRMAYNNYIA